MNFSSRCFSSRFLFFVFLLAACPAFADDVPFAPPDHLKCLEAGAVPPEVMLPVTGESAQEFGALAVELGPLAAAYQKKHPDQTRATVGQMVGGCEAGWVPAYFRAGRLPIESEAVVATGVLSEADLPIVIDKARALGIETAESGPAAGWIVFFRDLVPEYLRSRDVLVDLETGDIAGWPPMTFSADLNIPEFTWRLSVQNEKGTHSLAEWPVVVGRLTKRTPRTAGTVYCTMLHHYPAWIDPETGKYTAPGKHNPLGIWKLMPTEPKRAMWYYHGTNQPGLLNRKWRAFSHGCIRNRNTNIANLALFLITRNSGELLPSGHIAGNLSYFSEKRTRLIPLNEAVAAKNRYHCLQVVKSEDGASVLRVFPDIYSFYSDDGNAHRGIAPDNVKEKLLELGFEKDSVDLHALLMLTSRLRKTKVATDYPIETLKEMMK